MSQEIAYLRVDPKSGDVQANEVQISGPGQLARIVDPRAPFSSETASKTADVAVEKTRHRKVIRPPPPRSDIKCRRNLSVRCPVITRATEAATQQKSCSPYISSVAASYLINL